MFCKTRKYVFLSLNQDGKGFVIHFFPDVSAVFHHCIGTQPQNFSFLFHPEAKEGKDDEVALHVGQFGVCRFQVFHSLRVGGLEVGNDAFPSLVAFGFVEVHRPLLQHLLRVLRDLLQLRL